MKGKVIVRRPTDGCEVVLPPGMKLVDSSRQFFTDTQAEVRLKPQNFFTRIIVKVFPSWPWGQWQTVLCFREDRMDEKLQHVHPDYTPSTEDEWNNG